MNDPSLTPLLVARVVVLVGGLAFAGYQDWRVREVDDLVWQAMGVVGWLLGVIAFWGDALALVLWAVMGLWALEHLFPWDARLKGDAERRAGWIEIGVYVAAIGVLVGSCIYFGVAGSGVPIAIIAVAASILLARGLFEVGVLYGGADAKALIVAGVILPLDAIPLWSPPTAAALLGYYPFTLTVLIDAALFAVIVPIAILARNLSTHEFSFPRGFTGYTIPVAELPDRFVWVKDPTFGWSGSSDEPEPQTTEEDRELRRRQAEELKKQGVERVWVTPQLPFILWILAGAVAALLAGNLVFDLLSAL